MPDERDPLRELEETLALFARQWAEAQKTAARVRELGEEVLKRAKERGKTRVITELPKRDTRVWYGSPDERAAAFARALRKLDQPFTVGEASWITLLARRTTQRRLDEAIERNLVVRESFGKYRVK